MTEVSTGPSEMMGNAGPGMLAGLRVIEIADERARNKKLSNFTTQQADAHQLPFADQSFDLATCRFGVMFFTNVQRALTELRRVLKPGARACFAAWGPIDQPYWQTMMGVVHRHVGGPLLESGGLDPFRYAAPGRLAKLLQDAGFSSVEQETKTLPWTWAGPVEDVWEYAQSVSVPFRPMLQRVPSDQWPKINAEVHAALRRYSDGDKIAFGASVVFASGTR